MYEVDKSCRQQADQQRNEACIEKVKFRVIGRINRRRAIKPKLAAFPSQDSHAAEDLPKRGGLQIANVIDESSP